MTKEGPVAVVTGAGSGIGRAVCLKLLANNWRVALAGRRQEALEETVAMANVDARRVLAMSSDVSNPASVDALFDAIATRFGRLDLLFNNAGSSTPGHVALEDLKFEQWEQTIGANVTGAFLCTKAAFRIMKEQSPMGGRIINNGSISAHAPRPNSAPYTASKHAITGLTKATSLDGRKYNIACGQIDIGNARTEMASVIEKGVMQANGEIAAEPMIGVENVADTVLYLAELPVDVNVQFLTILPTHMPFIGRG